MIPVLKEALMTNDKRLEGILIPMPVAFKSDGSVDDKGTDAFVDFYLTPGVQGFFPLGTHGQGMVMEIDERKKAAERIAGRSPVVLDPEDEIKSAPPVCVAFVRQGVPRDPTGEGF